MVPFPGLGLADSIPPGECPAKKSYFSSCPVSGPFSECFRRLPRRALGSLLEGSGIFFFAPGATLCAACEKALFWSVSWSAEQMSPIAKTCKPYSTSFKNRRCTSDGLGLPRCVPKELILATTSLIWRSQTRPKIYVLWHMIQSLHFGSPWVSLGGRI